MANLLYVSIPFKRESVSKASLDYTQTEIIAVSIPFKRESVSKELMGYLGKKFWLFVSIPFKRESVSKDSEGGSQSCRPLPRETRFNSLQTGKCIQRDPILSPVGPWLQNPKTKREVREAFFTSKFTPKIPQTHVCIDPNAIF